MRASRSLKRTRLEQDRRVKALELTPLGRSVYTELREDVRRYDAKISIQMTQDERDVLTKLSVRISQQPR